MQTTKAMHALQQDLKMTIASVKKSEYRRELEAAHDLIALKSIEHKIRTDFQLTQDDRVQLLGDIERVAALAS